eukprot:1613188-Amphidinium_carterae.1
MSKFAPHKTQTSREAHGPQFCSSATARSAISRCDDGPARKDTHPRSMHCAVLAITMSSDLVQHSNKDAAHLGRIFGALQLGEACASGFAMRLCVAAFAEFLILDRGNLSCVGAPSTTCRYSGAGCKPSKTATLCSVARAMASTCSGSRGLGAKNEWPR